MITGLLRGGLGNQLFTISSTYVLAKDNNDECGFNFSGANPLQGNNPLSYRNTMYRKLKELPIGWKPTIVHKERQAGYYKIPYQEGMLLDGYFAGEKYINHRREEIIDLFIDTNNVRRLTIKYRNILCNSVSVHVRRGDYLVYDDVYVQLTMDYYNRALAMIERNATIENILVISDDMKWCRYHFKDSRVTFIEGNPDFYDMHLMSMTDHNIIANSTFSWWGSYFNDNPNKIVVAPEKWFVSEGVVKGRPDNAQHVFCDNWIKI